MTLPTVVDAKAAIGRRPVARRPSAGQDSARSASCWSISARPTAPTYTSMRRYLREFLSDPRVIEVAAQSGIRSSTASCSTRGRRKSGANYAKIWNREKNESPLRTYTRAQARSWPTRLRRPAECRRRLGACATAIRRSRARRRADRARLRPHPARSRSIRNTRRPPRRPSTTRSSAR